MEGCESDVSRGFNLGSHMSLRQVLVRTNAKIRRYREIEGKLLGGDSRSSGEEVHYIMGVIDGLMSMRLEILDAMDDFGCESMDDFGCNSDVQDG